MTQDHQEHIVVEPDGFFPLCGKSEPSVQGPVGAGRQQCEDVRKGLRDSGLFSEIWGRLREASFAWMLPGSRRTGGNSMTGHQINLIRLEE